MKTYILSLGAIALVSSFAFAEGDAKAERDGKKKRPNPAEIFKHLDKDGSGSVSKDEFLAGPRAQKNPERAAEIFGKIDKDSSGDVTRDEFAQFQKHRKNHKAGDRPKDRKPEGDAAPGGAIE